VNLYGSKNIFYTGRLKQKHVYVVADAISRFYERVNIHRGSLAVLLDEFPSKKIGYTKHHEPDKIQSHAVVLFLF